jgi:putative ABC transport system permease protein
VGHFWRDFRFGLRLLGKNKGFTAIAVLALALGIGPNTAIFTVLYATLLAPMPYPKPDQLVMVWSEIQGGRNVVSAGDYLDWKRDSKSFQGLWAWSGFSANLGGREGPEQVPGQEVSPGFIKGIGTKLMLGRGFLPEEGQPGRNHVVVLMHRLWERRFGADPHIVGRNIQMNGEPYTVVGVLAPGQQDRMPNQFWVPLAFNPEQINHDFHWLLVTGRLKDGITIQQAQADMDAVTKHIGEIYLANKGWGASVEPLRNDFLPKERIRGLYMLMGAVGFVLLIACANLANLLLARGTARQREIAVRSSLGAPRRQIFAQFLTESVALALMGGIAGVGLGWGILQALIAAMPPNTLPSEADLSLNLPILLFSLAATILAGALAGCAPAWQAARLDLNDVLKQSGRSLSGGKHWLRRTLVVTEFALAVTLLAGAGLAVHSFWKLTRLDLGVRTDHILTFDLPIPQGRMTNADQIRNFYRDMLSRIESVPGVVAATASTGLPLEGPGFGMPFTIVGRPPVEASARPGAGFQMVTPGYFKVFGVQMVRGRALDEHDVSGGVRAAVVSETFVRRYMKDVDPLRQRISVEEIVPGVQKLGAPQEWQIVGVFRNVQYGDRPSNDFPVIYVPFWQTGWPNDQLAVRTLGDPASMTKSIAAAVHSIDPDLPLADTETMDHVVSESRAGDRFSTLLIGSFAAVALLLAALGIYGVMAFLVEQRTHEIGLRMALGAGRAAVLRLIMGEGLTLAASGLLFGMVGAWLVGRAMQGLLYGVAAIDFTAFGAVAAVLLISAMLASWLPAQRAVAVDPIRALREG